MTVNTFDWIVNIHFLIKSKLCTLMLRKGIGGKADGVIREGVGNWSGYKIHFQIQTGKTLILIKQFDNWVCKLTSIRIVFRCMKWWKCIIWSAERVRVLGIQRMHWCSSIINHRLAVVSKRYSQLKCIFPFSCSLSFPCL